MKNIIREIVIRLLYLTPIGYLLSFADLRNKNKTRGIVLSMHENEPTHIEVKNNPSFGDRAYWFFNGIVLILQAWFILYNQATKRSKYFIEDIDNFIGGYAVFAAIFGLASVVSAFYPKMPWNKKLL